MGDMEKQANQMTHVLVVNDDPAFRELLLQVLSEEGFTVETADDGQQALVRLRQSRMPRIMLLDDRMPVMDGFEVLQELATDLLLASQTRCVFLTARSHPLPLALTQLLLHLQVPVLRYPFALTPMIQAVEEAAARLPRR